jgi:hypothetical protein
MNTITLSAGNVSLTAELNDSPTAQQIWRALPIEDKANRMNNSAVSFSAARCLLM